MPATAKVKHLEQGNLDVFSNDVLIGDALLCASGF